MPTITPGRNELLQGNQRQARVRTTITSAQLLALNATPITVVPAPGAGLAVVPDEISLFLDFNTAAYAGIAAGEDLSLKYTGAAGEEQLQVESTGFLDAVADAYRNKKSETTLKTPVANAVLALHLLVGEITTGDSPLEVEVLYHTVIVDLP